MDKTKVTLIIVVVALCAVIGYLILGKNGCSTSVDTECASSDSAAVINNIITRTSIRAYDARPVEDAKIETILRAGMAAPTAVNLQPWKFVVIKDKQTLKAISENFRSMKMAENAALAIVVCGDMELTLKEDAKDFWVQDVSAATENMLLAAHGLGLGAVWCGIYPVQERVKALSELLNLPENIIPLNVVPIGYPAETPEPKDKWKPENVHYETWN
jgi:nitroreductase